MTARQVLDVLGLVTFAVYGTWLWWLLEQAERAAAGEQVEDAGAPGLPVTVTAAPRGTVTERGPVDVIT